LTDLVYATHSGLYFVRLDSNLEIEHSTLIEEGYHYGITTQFDPANNKTNVVAYRGGDNVHKQTDREMRRFVIDDCSIEQVGKHDLPEDTGHVHQLVHGPEDSILIANTEENSVDIWTPEDGIIDRYRFNGHTHDVNHINSIFICKDLIAVMLHNFRKLESQVSICEIGGLKIQELGRFSLNDFQCHNIGILKDQMFYNASGARGIVRLDLKTLKSSGRIRMKEHTKGLSGDGKHIYSGMSNYAGRSERARSSAWAVVIDPQSMELVKTIQLTEPSRGVQVGNMNEIRVVGKEDVLNSGTHCDFDAMKNTTKVSQNQLAIQLRRSWIRGSDPIKRMIRKAQGK
jgi:hypothetical protein